MKRIVFLVTLLASGLLISSVASAQWKYEEYTNVLNGASAPLTTGDILTVSDTLMYAPTAKPAVTAVNEIANIIALSFNEPAQFGTTQLPDTFSITVNTTVKVLQTSGGTLNTTTRNFTITYSKDHPYQKSDIFYFNNGRTVTVELTGVSAYNININLAKSIVLLTNDMRIDRSYTTTCTGCEVGAFNSYVNNITGVADTLTVSWPINKWAKAYDLEWTYISKEAYADNRYGTSTSAAFAKNIFRNNASRVTTTDLSYNIPLLFNDTGYVYFRYRAVQLLANGERVTSQWSPDINLVTGLGKSYFLGHQNNLNWQSANSFAEEAKLKSVVQYYDGTLRERQTVTKDNMNKTTIVAESLYDHQGKPVISVLPAPTLNTVIQFHPLFSTRLNVPGSEYTKDLYDGLAATSDYCNGAAPGMSTDTGASRYYSPQNPLKQNGFNRYIPDAETFPFSETKYTQDNTGRVAAQGGVGKEFRLGTNHETKFYYTAANQTDLDALFGTDVGDASHYSKNMVRDANGQYNVSYVDMKGRTIATALAGASPATLQQLDSYQSVSQTETLLTPENNIAKQNSVIFTRTLAVPKSGTYTFAYTLNSQTLKLNNWADQQVCYDCLYDLTITIADECNNTSMPGGVPYVYKKSNFSLNSINSNCTDPARGLAESFNITLPEGSYTVTKELSISQAGKAYYRDNVYLPNNLKTTFEDIYNQQMELVKQQLGDCSTNGNIVKKDEDDANTYADLMFAQLVGDGIYANQKIIKDAYALYLKRFPNNPAIVKMLMLWLHPEYQLYQNYRQLTASNKWDEEMNAITTFAEAVQAGYLNPLQMATAPASSFPSTNPDPFFLNNTQFKSKMVLSVDRAMVTNVVLSIPIAWANLWSLSNMMVKCDVKPNGLMDGACINQYKIAGNVFNSSLLCETELDEAWNKFKAIYLGKKKILTSEFLFASGYPTNVDPLYRIFVDPRPLINQPLLGVNTNGNDPNILKQQAQAALAQSIDNNCRSYAAYWWSKLEQADCLFQKTRDSAILVNRLIAVCKEGGDETHPFGASTVKPGSTNVFKSFNEAIVDYVKNTLGVNPDITTCNGVLINAPGPYARPFITVYKPITDKPDDCECSSIKGLTQVYQTSYTSKYSTMSSFMQAVYKTTITDGALDTLRRMCNNEFDCVRFPIPLSADLTFSGITSGDQRATNSITLQTGFEATASAGFSATIVSGGLPSAIILPPVFQCGNVQNVCVDCEKVTAAFTAFGVKYPGVTPTKNSDTARKNIFFAGFMNDQTGLDKTATEYLDFKDLCNSTPGSNAGSIEIVGESNCPSDTIAMPYSGVAKPSGISCADLIKTYKNFIVEFPNHTKGATVTMYVNDGGSALNNNTLNESTEYFASAEIPSLKSSGGPSVPGEFLEFSDTTPPVSKKFKTVASALLINGYWMDSVMTAKNLFQWYMNEHFQAGYTYLNYADWLINSCGYKLYQLPWSDTVAVRQDTLQNIWNRFVVKYPVSLLNISETVNIPIVKAVGSYSDWAADDYFPEYLNSLRWTNSYWFTTRTVNNYNLTILPKNATLTSAALSLYAYKGLGSYAPHFRDINKFPFMQIQQVKGLYIPGRSTFDNQPGYYPGVPAFNLPYATTDRVSSGNSNDFWSQQDYPNQNVLSLVNAMYTNMVSTGVNYPVQYKLNDETQEYKEYQFGGPECSNGSKRPVLNVAYTAARCDVFAAYVNRELGTYMSVSEVKDVYALMGKMVINENCTSYIAGEGCVEPLPVKVYASDLLLCGSSTEPTFIPLPASVLPNACKDSVSMAWSLAQEIYNYRKDSLLANFENEYTQKCLGGAAFETLTMTGQVSEYHYTLYYYDQAGNLVKTVPPAGVVVNRTPVWLADVKLKRSLGQAKPGLHTKYTLYRYNSLNKVISQFTPDGGQSNFWYDRLGRIAISRNAEQKKTNLYSYTQYDIFGRIIEVGQKQQPNGITDAIARDNTLLNNWVNLTNSTYPHKQVTRTLYDLPATISQVYTQFNQKSYTLRNRISYMQLFDQLQYTSNVPTYLNHTQATYYNYDIHGNVDTLLQDYAVGTMSSNGYNRFKLVAYGYDLAIGKVNLVSYQPGRQDEMYHRYEYDADNKITGVYTTHRKAFVGDRNVEERDARYNYYRHGLMARMELGNNVQGLDYSYTLQGWLKGVNSTALTPVHDMMTDGSNTANLIARDAIGFSLNYYLGDYKSIDATALPFAEAGAYLGTSYKQLFNGNISNMSVGIKGLKTMLYNYRYDQLSRLVNMDAFIGFDSLSNQWSGLTNSNKYWEAIGYDANSNITLYSRDGDKAGAQAPMDRLQYNYVTGTNKLNYIQDNVADAARYSDDIETQLVDNYDYDAIGNMIKDTKEGISTIDWTVYGKVKKITKTDGMVIDYTYDAAGGRISKTLSGTGVTGGPITTWYVLDARGNTLSTYTLKAADITVDEQFVYGADRIGAKNRRLALNSSLNIPSSTVPGIGVTYNDFLMRGSTQYELSNHLGNVLATISDKKVAHITGGAVDYYEPQILSAQDYYPFGMVQPGRKYSNGAYRFGFNGQEMSNEIKGEGNSYTAKFWEYDPRVGRRWNLDPIYNTDISRYAVNGLNPIYFEDPLGNFKTKFGAKVYAFFNGGDVSRAGPRDSKKAGEWYVSRQVEDKSNNSGVTIKRSFSWGGDDKRKVGSGGLVSPMIHPGDALDQLASRAEDFSSKVPATLSDAWNSPLARAIVPDYLTFSGNFQTSSGIYISEELTFTLMLRGKDPGLYFNTSTGAGGISSVGVDVGVSMGKGYYLGDSRDLSSKMLGGWQASASGGVAIKAVAGLGVTGGVDVGLDDNNKPATITTKKGVSIGVGVSTPIQGSGGAGYGTPAIPLFKF